MGRPSPHERGRPYQGIDLSRAAGGGWRTPFTYSIDYVMLDAEAPRVSAPWLFGRNRAGLTSLQDADHGGPPKDGRGAPWARDVLAAHGLAEVTGGTLIAARAAADAGAMCSTRSPSGWPMTARDGCAR